MRSTRIHPLAIVLPLLVVAVAAVLASTDPASAKSSINTQTLIPPPPPGADCRADGNQVICHTAVIEPERSSEPLFDLPCGTVYETSTDVRRGIRWYDSSSRTIVKRVVFFYLEGTWNLSSSGAGPVTKITVHALSRDVAFPDPEDQDTWPTTFYGVGFSVQAKSYGVIEHVSAEEGYGPDEDAHGVVRALSDQDVSTELCAALGA